MTNEYGARFTAILTEHVRTTGGLMIGDTFAVDDRTYRVASFDGRGSFHFERLT